MTDLRAKFIVFDGPDGCGKSTQVRLLADALQKRGVPTLVVRDPGTTSIGEQIRALLLNPAHQEMSMRCEMLLYMAARAQMMAQTILPALEQGTTILSDRFVSSTLAYQLGGDGLTAQEIRAVATIAIRGRWPDRVILLDMPPERGFERVHRARDRIEQRPMAYHEQVRRNYLSQAHADPTYRIINADRPPEVVHAEVLEVVLSDAL